MGREDTISTTGNTPETPVNSMLCPLCGEAASHMFDEELGYYKQCSGCGHIEYLNRRFLRFDKSSRRWQ
jgi:hypothetical protein